MKNQSSRKFFSLINDLDIFRFGIFNLSNLFYSSFLSKANQDSRKKTISLGGNINKILKSPVYLFLLFFRLIEIRLRKFTKPRILFKGNSGRHTYINGNIFDLYNARIIEECDEYEFVVVEEYRDGINDQFPTDFYYKEDFTLLTRIFRLLFQVLNFRSLESYADKIQEECAELPFKKNEIKKIVCNFYVTYYLSRLLVRIIDPRQVLLICHYGNEAFTAACKYHGVKVIELMHGSISDSHPHYNYPEDFIRKVGDVLFPDKIAVYGEFWKNILVKGNLYPTEAIEIVGYYLKTPEIDFTLPGSSKKVMLITSQWTVVNIIHKYVEFLKQKLDRNLWRIIIKPHPAEDPTTYLDLLETDFVQLSNSDIYTALYSADIHISVYSSVLYEAVRYNVTNYVLLVDEYKDEYQMLINSGIALPLNNDQIPECLEETSIPSEFFFAKFDPSALFD